MKFIRYLGAATDWQEAKTDVNNFHVLNDGKPSFWREALRLRVSGRKATKLAKQLFSEALARGAGNGNGHVSH